MENVDARYPDNLIQRVNTEFQLGKNRFSGRLGIASVWQVFKTSPTNSASGVYIATPWRGSLRWHSRRRRLEWHTGEVGGRGLPRRHLQRRRKHPPQPNSRRQAANHFGHDKQSTAHPCGAWERSPVHIWSPRTDWSPVGINMFSNDDYR